MQQQNKISIKNKISFLVHCPQLKKYHGIQEEMLIHIPLL